MVVRGCGLLATGLFGGPASGKLFSMNNSKMAPELGFSDCISFIGSNLQIIASKLKRNLSLSKRVHLLLVAGNFAGTGFREVFGTFLVFLKKSFFFQIFCLQS